MKKCLLSIIALIMVIALSACASEPASEIPGGNSSKVATGEVLPSESDYSIEELTIQGDGLNIWGKLYLPAGAETVPLAICSHGFGGSYRNTEEYAENFARRGIAAFSFDFTGGGSGSRSGGSTSEMSVLTEAADLGCVLEYFKNYSGIDPERIFLFGESQGGFVSTYVAGTRPEDVAGLVVLYPAYVLQDNSRESNPNPQSGPETSSLMGVRIGRIYDVDAQSFDIYEVMANYSGKVLIIHGTSDSIAPISYSERAAETFSNAQLVKIDGAGHGFYGSSVDQASQLVVSFILNEDEESATADDMLANAASSADVTISAKEAESESAEQAMKLKIGDREITVAWEENESVEALREFVSSQPLSISMSMYGGFEQVGPIGTSLPRNDVQTTTAAGDIVLYSGNQIVVFYGSNSWAYTRLGKIQGLSGQELAELLGNGNVTLTLSME